jgi:hypothetical protein
MDAALKKVQERLLKKLALVAGKRKRTMRREAEIRLRLKDFRHAKQ